MYLCGEHLSTGWCKPPLPWDLICSFSRENGHPGYWFAHCLRIHHSVSWRVLELISQPRNLLPWFIRDLYPTHWKREQYSQGPLLRDMPLAKQKNLLVKLAISLEKVWSEEGLLRCSTSTIASRRITLILLECRTPRSCLPHLGKENAKIHPTWKGEMFNITPWRVTMMEVGL